MAFSSKLAADFAVNLRNLCKVKKSIAEVCRATQIHRQQFNKYLSGNSLPNAHNLSKICNYLDVSAEVLFSSEGAAKTSPSSNRTENLDSLSQATTLNLPFITSGACMPSGSYYCYFPFLGGEDFVLRSYIKIWNTESQTLFTRLTRLGKPNDASSFLVRGRHNGRVIRTGDEISFIGINKQSPNQISLINVAHRPSMNGHYFGLAITRAAEKSVVCLAALQFLGNPKSARDGVKSLGIFKADDKSVPRQIRSAIFNSEDTAPRIIVAPSSDEIIARSF